MLSLGVPMFKKNRVQMIINKDCKLWCKKYNIGHLMPPLLKNNQTIEHPSIFIV